MSQKKPTASKPQGELINVTELLGHVLICYRIYQRAADGPQRQAAFTTILQTLETLDKAIQNTPLSATIERGVEDALVRAANFRPGRPQ